MLEISSKVVPRLRSLTVCGALKVCTVCVPKSKLCTESSTTVPVPVNETICGLDATPSVIVRDPLLNPLTLGLKTTFVLQ